MAREELVELFDVDGLQKKAAVFDPKKLEWMNGQHLSRMSAEALASRVTPELLAAGLVDAAALETRRDWYFVLLDMLKVRARTVHDIVQQAAPYFRDEIEYDAEAVSNQWKDGAMTAEVLTRARERLGGLQAWSPEEMEGSLRGLAEELGVSGGKVFQPLRVALTGTAVSPGIFEVLVAMGRKRALHRLERAVAYLRQNGSDG